MPLRLAWLDISGKRSNKREPTYESVKRMDKTDEKCAFSRNKSETFRTNSGVWHLASEYLLPTFPAYLLHFHRGRISFQGASEALERSAA